MVRCLTSGVIARTSMCSAFGSETSDRPAPTKIVPDVLSSVSERNYQKQKKPRISEAFCFKLVVPRGGIARTSICSAFGSETSDRPAPTKIVPDDFVEPIGGVVSRTSMCLTLRVPSADQNVPDVLSSASERNYQKQKSPANARLFCFKLVVPRGGIEPPTRGFSIPCSTD